MLSIFWQASDMLAGVVESLQQAGIKSVIATPCKSHKNFRLYKKIFILFGTLLKCFPGVEALTRYRHTIWEELGVISACCAYQVHRHLGYNQMMTLSSRCVH